MGVLALDLNFSSALHLVPKDGFSESTSVCTKPVYCFDQRFTVSGCTLQPQLWNSTEIIFGGTPMEMSVTVMIIRLGGWCLFSNPGLWENRFFACEALIRLGGFPVRVFPQAVPYDPARFALLVGTLDLRPAHNYSGGGMPRALFAT